MTKVLICIAAFAHVSVTSCRIAEPTNRQSMPRVRSASFFGTAHAWVVTSTGELLLTARQGNNWERISAETVGGFKTISFIDAQQGWAISETGQVWSSQDGGHKWKPIAKLTESPEDINFTDHLHGYAIEPFSLWLTENGGVSWERYFPLANPDGIEEPTHSSCFVSNRVGYLGGERGAIYHTSDGGKSWRGKRVVRNGLDVSAIFFIDERVGWFSSRPNSSIYYTDDGGITWREQLLPAKTLDILSIHFTDKNNGWAVGTRRDGNSTNHPGSRGVIVQTGNGGMTWELVATSPGGLSYNRVFFGDSQNGWLIDRDDVYSTNDGGRSWSHSLRLP